MALYDHRKTRDDIKGLSLFMSEQKSRIKAKLNTLPRRIARRQTRCYSGPLNIREEAGAAFDADRALLYGAIPQADIEVRK